MTLHDAETFQDTSSTEWTLVSRKKNQPLKGKSTSKKQQYHLARAKQQLELFEGEQSGNDPSDEQISKLIEDVNLLVSNFRSQEILIGSKDEVPKNLHDYVYQLKQTILESINLNEFENDEDSSADSRSQIQEIICYGIGNFSKGSGMTIPTSKYSSPIIQLACALLLRESLVFEAWKVVETGNMFKQYQRHLPIRYFEPFMKPIERKVLEHFHVELLENEQGKRRILLDDENCSPEKSFSLFFMPHCPMRLYSNVLWANWFELSRLLIFGNSFKAYDKRVVASDLQKDDSNGIFSLLDHVCEKEVGKCGDRRRRSHRNDDMVTSLDVAFNDCVVISFDMARDFADWPQRPTEYFVNTKCTDNEIM